MPTKLAPKLLSWATDLDDKTIEQARISSEMPFVQPHISLMPDAHYGYGVTVGSVIPTKGAIMPSAVGFDIGCGMIAAQLDLTAAQLPDDLQPMHSAIAASVPAGVGQGHQAGRFASGMIDFPTATSTAWTEKIVDKAFAQFGTLGSGNHFIEVCLDENDQVWIVLHSGSRGTGKQLAEHHIDRAKGLMARYFITLDEPDLAYFAEGTPEFDAYITDMLWAQDYAMANRGRMLMLVHSVLTLILGRTIDVVDQVDCHHNFTQLEHHMARNLWITRKGAIQARAGDRGVIPGSMGAATYIVSGNGVASSFMSCSHGAGRRLGRKQAERELTSESLWAAMDGKVWNQDLALLDEHPSAYKNIDDVMAAQQDLVTIDHTLRQVLNYKGT